MQNNPTAIPVVAVALLRADGRVLMQRRRAKKAHGGLWEFPGGKVEVGETPDQALVREIAEELGIGLDERDLKAVGFASAPESTPIEITLFACRSWAGEPLALDADAIAWFAPGELAALAMPPLDVLLAEALLEAI